MPPVAQYLLPGLVGHVIAPHALASGPHVTSHLHECVHATLAHAGAPDPELDEPSPVQPIVHAPTPQLIAPHAASPAHVTLHDAALVHVTCGQLAAVVHVITQFQVAGHVTSAPVPCIMHVPVGKSHEAHWGGHTAASIGGASGVPTTQ
jgi:hypothetical protein